MVARVCLLQKLCIAKVCVSPPQRASEERQTCRAQHVARRTGAEDSARVVDGFFEGLESFVMCKPVVQNHCDAHLG